MFWMPVLPGPLAEAANSSNTTLFRQMSPEQRVQVTAALVIILALGGLLWVVIRAGRRIVHGYGHQPGRLTRFPGDRRSPSMNDPTNPRQTLDEYRRGPK